MRTSDPINVGTAGNGKTIEITFVHTDNFTVIAEITAKTIPGLLRLIRKDDESWIMLEDTLDRTKLYEGKSPYPLQFDLEKIYHQYTVDLFVT